MNQAFLLIIVLFVVSACQKKAVPVITERKYEPPKGVTTFPPPGTINPDTIIGKTVFVSRCGKCHGLPEPIQFTAERWDGILSYMMPRARLDEAQKIHLAAYIKANAAK